MKNKASIVLLALALACGQGAHEEGNDGIAPEENRFVKEVFVTNLFEPTELDVLPDGKILFTQRRGAIKQYDPATGAFITYDSIPVFHEFEDGLMGMALDPDFEQNQWVYLYYSPVGDRPVQFLSRFSYTLSGLKDEIVMLEVDVQRNECCHTGGSIEFGPEGLLFLSTGDDTNPFASEGYGPMDNRVGREDWDARRSSANTNDLRGKILRIRPELDGSYSIPKGNLFEDEDPKTRPEIYVMGCRNPYRIAVDRKRGWLFWGDVGPDANNDDSLRGPRGHDEFNIATKPGNYGWPLFVADNRAYRQYDYATQTSGAYYDPEHPVNDSHNNTGVKELPPAIPAPIFYPYANSSVFPQVRNGGRNAMAGPVYYSDLYEGHNKFPAFFDGRVFFFDWMRGFIFSLGLDEEGQITDWYPFVPHMAFNNLMDMAFGPDGQLYILEYGTGWFTQNENAVLARIRYEGGNRAPVLRAELSKTNGAAPLKVLLDATASEDYDGDRLSYRWEIEDEVFTDSVFTYVFDKEGIYYPELIVSDQKGNKRREQFVVEVGNEAPEVNLHIDGNTSFFWKDREVHYQVQVSDLEDGTLDSGIDPLSVQLEINHYQSTDRSEVLGHQVAVSSGETLIGSLDCKSCHKLEGSSIGPSYRQVANRYKNDPGAMSYLSRKIINGGGGVWGEQAMSAHPDLSEEDAGKIVEYLLSLSKVSKYPLSGTYKTNEAMGRYIFRAAYEDKGKYPLKSNRSEKIVTLQHNVVSAADFDTSKDVKIMEMRGGPAFLSGIFDGSWIGFQGLDLTGIGAISIRLSDIEAGGELLVKEGSATGNLLAGITIRPGAQQTFEVPLDKAGLTDIFFVFSNPNTKDQLWQVHQIEFLPKP